MPVALTMILASSAPASECLTELSVEVASHGERAPCYNKSEDGALGTT